MKALFRTAIHDHVEELLRARPDEALALLARVALLLCERELAGDVLDEVRVGLAAALRTEEESSTHARRRLCARAEERYLSAGRAAALVTAAAASASVAAFHRARGDDGQVASWTARCLDQAVAAVARAGDTTSSPAEVGGVPVALTDLLPTWLDEAQAAEAGQRLLVDSMAR